MKQTQTDKKQREKNSYITSIFLSFFLFMHVYNVNKRAIVQKCSPQPPHPLFVPHPIEESSSLTRLAFSPCWILLRLATGCDEIMSLHWKLSSFLSRKSYRLNFQWKMQTFLSRNELSYPLNFQWKLLSIFSRISNILRSSFSFWWKLPSFLSRKSNILLFFTNEWRSDGAWSVVPLKISIGW